MKFGILVNIRRDEAIEAAAALVAWFEERRVDFLLERAAAKVLEMNARGAEAVSFADTCDIIISLGGDGTILRAARIAGSKPILGINLGRLGFLAEFSVQEMYPAIERVLKKKFTIETRTQLEARVRIGKRERVFTALNDVIIEKGGYPRVPTISIRIEGQLLSDYRADGLIIATSTGSTAYSMSAGGPIIAPKSRVFVITPICPHMLTVRPIVINDDREIELSVESGHNNFVLNCDGQVQEHLSPESRIRICKSKTRAKLIANDKRNYYDVLRSKFFWGQEHER
ncbi:MAG: NAD(+)/NADH kinase [Rhizobacter sp.]|nr:NAD(+)/NADH kinase [Chlorobiales bacterium]